MRYVLKPEMRAGGIPVMNFRTHPFLALLCLSLTTAGCGPNRGPEAPPPPPVIPISRPVVRQVTDFVDYTGRTDAVNSVGIRPRVSGYLVKIPFREGAEVKKGDLLFEIDPRPYQAQLDQAQSQVALNQASLTLAQSTYARDRAIGTSAVSPQQLEQDRAAVEETQARVKASQATVENYRLNVEFTRVTSPIDGQVSRYYLTIGNLAIQDQTLLTTVVSLDPVYAYFDIDEPTLLRIRRAINEGKIQRAKDVTAIPVLMGLQGEEGYPHQGFVNFINNVINPSTGTLAIRGVFPNPEPPNGRRMLSPGMFVRIRLPIGQPHEALLVIDRAIGSDQGLKFVYVLDADNKVQYRRVTTGALEDDGLRVVEEGLRPDDRVVVGGLQQIRPRMQVQAEPTEMPTLGQNQAPSPVSGRPQPPPPGANDQGSSGGTGPKNPGGKTPGPTTPGGPNRP